MARDVLLFCQQRDPARMPAAWPVRSAEMPALTRQAALDKAAR